MLLKAISFRTDIFCDVDNPFDSVHSFIIYLSKQFFKKKCFVGIGNNGIAVLLHEHFCVK